jgi:hypothetical protein
MIDDWLVRDIAENGVSKKRLAELRARLNRRRSAAEVSMRNRLAVVQREQAEFMSMQRELLDRPVSVH